MIRDTHNRGWVSRKRSWFRISGALVLVLCALLQSCEGDAVTRGTTFLPTDVTDSQGSVELRLATMTQGYVVVDECTADPIPGIVTRAAATDGGLGLLLVDQAGEYLSMFAWADPTQTQMHLPRLRGGATVLPEAISVLPSDAGEALIRDFMHPRATVALADLGEAVASALLNEAWAEKGVVHLVDRTPDRAVCGRQCWSFTTFEVEMPATATDWYDFYRGICYADSDLFEIWTPLHPYLTQVLVLPVADKLPVPGATLGLEGIARDAETGLPVAGATLDLHPGGLRATTDASGFFSFDSVDLHCGGFRAIRLVACCGGYVRTCLCGDELALEVGVRNQLDVVLRRQPKPVVTPDPTSPPPTPSDAVAAVFVEMFGDCYGDASRTREELPLIRIENRSSTGIDITEIEMTVGDPAYNFDVFLKDKGPMDFQLLEPDTLHGNPSVRSHRFLVVFPGSSRYTAPGGVRFEPWDVLECRADIDPNYRDSTRFNFAKILYNNGPSPNSELTVRFSDGTTLSGTWPDNGDTVVFGDQSYCDLENSMFLTTDE
jgi:hypothetical protein